ncbi:MAG TPA: non-homologous end-joining DNA ligase [Dyella sp.]|uniref:non-homologous end-joining DNA ligase n=1 Tax=Dyella sp. TaxID=1869338 RepID=UPI002D786641|nr:non-homologous end-joining DNA ligase [Dyella sp.]HET6552240.1 non-homologous end-joining DNA ligase [Dyella sp.]
MPGNDISGIKITHPDRVLYPDEGFTKQDVVNYYAAVMRWFLPGVIGRPVSVLRFPDGLGEPGFFQKHPMRGLKHAGHVRLREESGESDDYLCPGDATSIIELVQFNAIEFHPWAARATSLETPDYLVFDLDPGHGVAWREVIEAARLVKSRLADLSLQSFVRTTGGKGLHVVAPLRGTQRWDDARRFSQAFAQQLVAEQPSAFIAKAAKDDRRGKIFIDYLRNTRGATSVTSYSLRARTGATVATPLRWQDLGKCTGASDFDMRSIPRRLARLRHDPWEGFAELRQDLREALRICA